MKQEEYAELYAKALSLDEDFQPVYIPMEQLPDESVYDTIIRFMKEYGMISIDGDDIKIVDEESINDYDPNLMKIMKAIWQSQQEATYDLLEEEGLMFTTVDTDGNIVRALTDAGRAALEDEC